jgi:hypothetical protein
LYEDQYGFAYKAPGATGSLGLPSRAEAMAQMEEKVRSGYFQPDAAKTPMRRVKNNPRRRSYSSYKKKGARGVDQLIAARLRHHDTELKRLRRGGKNPRRRSYSRNSKRAGLRVQTVWHPEVRGGKGGFIGVVTRAGRHVYDGPGMSSRQAARRAAMKEAPASNPRRRRYSQNWRRRGERKRRTATWWELLGRPREFTLREERRHARGITRKTRQYRLKGLRRMRAALKEAPASNPRRRRRGVQGNAHRHHRARRSKRHWPRSVTKTFDFGHGSRSGRRSEIQYKHLRRRARYLRRRGRSQKARIKARMRTYRNPSSRRRGGFKLGWLGMAGLALGALWLYKRRGA